MFKQHILHRFILILSPCQLSNYTFDLKKSQFSVSVNTLKDLLYVDGRVYSPTHMLTVVVTLILPSNYNTLCSSLSKLMSMTLINWNANSVLEGNLSIYLSFYLFIFLSIYLSIYLYICLSIGELIAWPRVINRNTGEIWVCGWARPHSNVESNTNGGNQITQFMSHKITLWSLWIAKHF